MAGPDVAARFATACVASPHHLATEIGRDVLAAGGNAMDAAVATNLALGVVVPYLCGYGGDLFAMVWAEGELSAYNGSGRAPAAATPGAVRAAAGADRMPVFGPLAVTVPGAVEAWFVLLERFGTRTFAELARPALRLAREGFAPTARAMQSLDRAKGLYAWSETWQEVYGRAAEGIPLVQPGLARTIERLISDGPDAYYGDPIGPAIAGHLRGIGGLMAPEDLAGHGGDWNEPLTTTYRGVEVFELPPNTQGVAALEALNIVEALGPLPSDGPGRQHLLIEAMKLALTDRDEHVTDAAAMRTPAERLASAEWAIDRAARVRADRTAGLRPGRPALGGTAYLCAADGGGMLVSMIQSNFIGFGSGVTVPEWGINLQNRGAYFSLDPEHVNVIAPSKRTLHTLIPAMAFREGRPWLVFGSMGGDGQAQTHLQLLARIVDDGQDIQGAIGAPRWLVSPDTWSVTMEARFDPGWVQDLRRRGHDVTIGDELDRRMGHAHAIRLGDGGGGGYEGATDPRVEGAVLGM